jgi:hypothetical protein
LELHIGKEFNGAAAAGGGSDKTGYLHTLHRAEVESTIFQGTKKAGQ